MKPINTLIAILFISLSSPSWSVTIGDLVERDGLYYKQFTDVPFTGEVTGRKQGSFESGKRDGAWVGYHENGQLLSKGNFKNGERDGAWVDYGENGALKDKGNFKNGERVGTFVGYHKNGQLSYKANYKYKNAEVIIVSYNEDGTVNEMFTGTFKNGFKISD